MEEVIRVENLVKRFGDLIALDGVSFKVNRGEIFGYIGPNGAGKTTTMRIMLGLITPTAGKVEILGENVFKSNGFRWKCGAVLESDGLYERMTAYENLDFYGAIFKISGEERSRRIKELLELVGLYDRRYTLVNNFSKGMKRKLAIARALIHDPDILFFDEPTAGLDPDARMMIHDLLLNLSRQRKRTIFLNSHNLDEVEKISSRVAILRKGRIIAMGSMDDLRKKFHKSQIIISLNNELDTRKVATLIQPSVQILAIEGNRILISTEAELSEILETIIKGGIAIKNVERDEASLEEMYMKIIKEDEKK
ncbi:MAG: ABC transporter ATP-binding protein [Thermoproteota archaeon]